MTKVQLLGMFWSSELSEDNLSVLRMTLTSMWQEITEAVEEFTKQRLEHAEQLLLRVVENYIPIVKKYASGTTIEFYAEIFEDVVKHYLSQRKVKHALDVAITYLTKMFEELNRLLRRE